MPLHEHSSGLPHGIPDLCDPLEPGCLYLNAGESLVLTGDNDRECVGVHGTLTLRGTLKTEHIYVYEDGTLIVETGSEVVWADVPFDPVMDPEHFGNGLVCFGKLRVNGLWVEPFVRLTADVQLGATQLALTVPPTWAVGHRLVLPDTRQLKPADLVPGSFYSLPSARLVDQSEVVVIAAITAQGVTLEAPTTYAHLGAHAPAVLNAPAIDLYPHVANLSRSVVFRSENPAGMRGHAIFSQRADVNIKGATFVHMGRTTGHKLNSTTFDADGNVTHIGTNQIGRYPVHFHHTFGPVTTADPYQFSLTDCVVEEGNKWGVAVHNSSWGLIKDNVVFGVSGNGYTTEDGNEIENTFDHNFACSVENHEFDLILHTYDPEGNRGTGYWFRSMANRVTRNVAYACRSGFAWYTGNDENPPLAPSHFQRIPAFRGADTTLDENIARQPPGYLGIQSMALPMSAIEDNEAGSSSSFGVEFWWSQGALTNLRADFVFQHLPITHTTVWHTCGVGTANEFQGAAIMIHYSDMTFDGMTLVNEGGFGLALLAVNDGGGMGLGYGHSKIAHADVRGFQTSWRHGGQIALPVYHGFEDSVFQTVDGFEVANTGESGAGFITSDGFGHFLLTSVIEWKHVQFAPVAGKPLKTIQPVFTHSTRLGYEGVRRIRLNVRDYQGVAGDNFRVYFIGQAFDYPAPEFLSAADAGVDWDLGTPEPGLTNQQAWNKYHSATLMQVAPVDATTRPEISGLIGPIPVDEPDVAPPLPPAPGPLPPGAPLPPCASCASVAVFMGHTFSLGAAHGGNFDILRDGAGFGGQGISFLVVGDVLWVRTEVDAWYHLTGAELPWVGGIKPVEATGPPLPMPVDCAFVWGEWSAWTPSNPQTDPPTEMRHREPTISKLAANGGRLCPVPQIESRELAVPPTPTPKSITQFLTPKIAITVWE